jgi:hypothetical protein
MIVIGHDPGRQNYAYCMLNVKVVKDVVRAKIIKSGFIRNTPNFKNVSGSIYEYMRELEDVYMYANARPECISIERFQGRGIKSGLLETVNLGLGAVVQDALSKSSTTKIITPTASAWKNALNRVVDLKKWYKVIRCTPHELDACLIAIYGAYKVEGLQPFYGYNDGAMMAIAGALERNTPKLRNRRCSVL